MKQTREVIKDKVFQTIADKCSVNIHYDVLAVSVARVYGGGFVTMNVYRNVYDNTVDQVKVVYMYYYVANLLMQHDES